MLTRPRTIRRTGDDTPAGSLSAFVRRMTVRHQPGACALAIATAALNLMPVDLQHRIVEGPISDATWAVWCGWG